MTDGTIAEIESILGYVFLNKDVLVNAFTHSSFANEQQIKSNERLEFLGDAVLGFLAARSLFFDPAYAGEGDLTRARQSLISRAPLAGAVKEMNLLRYLQVGRGENPAGWSEKAVSDLFEAVIGAVYVDSDEFAPCEALFRRAVFSAASPSVDPISVLKEYSEKNRDLNVYKEERTVEGSFVYVIFVGTQAFKGTGRAKKEAEREACRKACEYLKLI